MTLRTAMPRRFVVYAAVMILTATVLTTPAARSVIVGDLVGITDITERVLRIPCQLLDHEHCFSLDRFDPTCPQCM